MACAAELVLDAQNAVGESPVWHSAEQALYWVDIVPGRLHRWRLATGEVTTWQCAQMLGCISAGAHPAQWIAGMETGIFELLLGPAGPVESRLLCGVQHAQDAMRFNDGRCDRQGRFWVGSMVMDMSLASPAGALYRYTGGDLVKVVDHAVTPNGLAFSPDGRIMYLSDSHPTVQKVWAFDYDPDTGTPSHRRVFVDMNAYPGRPDGAAVDADGCYWVCANDAGLVHRFTPEGRLDRSLPVPVKKPAMCAFGGAHLDTLYVTSIRPAGIDLADQPLAGGVFALHPGVRGLPEPAFAFPSQQP